MEYNGGRGGSRDKKITAGAFFCVGAPGGPATKTSRAETRRIIDHCGAATGLTSSSPLRAHAPSLRRLPHGLEKHHLLGPTWTNLDLEASLVPARHPPSAVLVSAASLMSSPDSCIPIFAHFCPPSFPRNRPLGPWHNSPPLLGPPRRNNPRSVSVRHRTSRPQGWRRARYSVCSVEKDAAGASPITMTPQRGVGDSRLSNNPTGKMGARGARGARGSYVCCLFLEFDPHRHGISQDFLFLRPPETDWVKHA